MGAPQPSLAFHSELSSVSGLQPLSSELGSQGRLTAWTPAPHHVQRGPAATSCWGTDVEGMEGRARKEGASGQDLQAGLAAV